MERRRYLRFSADLEVLYWAAGAAAVAGRARVRDVSRQGVCVASPALLPRGESMEMTFHMPGDNVPVFATGQIVWAAPGASAPTAGIRFVTIKPLDLARLLDYSYARWLGA